MIEAIGFRFKRSGKGDHTVYARGAERIVIDGAPNHEMPRAAWKKLQKRYALDQEK